MRKRSSRDAGFKARVVLEALRGQRNVPDLAAEYGVYLLPKAHACMRDRRR